MLRQDTGVTVQNQNNPAADLAIPAEPTDAIESTERTPAPVRRPWQVEVSELLSQAAELCIEHGVDVDGYMSGAWATYVEARPGMRDQLEEAQLREQLAELRQLGRLASA
jgi:hypothetical protein